MNHQLDNVVTEYESLSLFFQILDTAHAALANYLTVVFAVVLVMFFAGRKLDGLSWGFLVVVYTLFVLGMVNEIVSMYSDMVRLGFEIGQTQSPVWFGMAAATDEGPVMLIPYVVGAMCVLAYLGSLVFSYQIRRRGKKRDIKLPMHEED